MTAAIEERVRCLPCWHGPVSLSPLQGGLSNTSFLVTDGDEKFVVRVGEDFPCHHVFRDREAAASRAAFAAGVSPEVKYAEPGLLVVRFLEARTYAEADIRADLARVIALMQRWHRDIPKYLKGPPATFWVFHVLRDYAHTLRDGGHALSGSLPQWLSTVDQLEAAQVPLPVVFGHHDILPANILDDGRRLWIIDWEYAGFGTAMFDLANLAVNNSLAVEDETRILETYFERAPDGALRRAFDAMKVASGLREAMWGMVSELHLDVAGVDYAAHAAEYLGRYETALALYRNRYGTS
ncbi:phosphotransferase family protein [soil metagenome]